MTQAERDCAEAMLAVGHDNAEVDAIEGNAPDQHLLDNDADYRRRYVYTLLARYRSLMAIGESVVESAEREVLSEVF